MRPLIVIAVLVGAAAPAMAQGVDDDVRCLLAGSVFARVEKDATKRQLAIAVTSFFSGRLDARVPTAQLRTRLATLGKGMAPATLGPVMNGCAARFRDNQAALHALGRQGGTPAR